jgi:hypothetical protein
MALFLLIHQVLTAYHHNGASTQLNKVSYLDILTHQRMSQLLFEPLMTLKQGCVARQIALS